MRNSIRNDAPNVSSVEYHGQFQADLLEMRVSLRRNADFEAFSKLRNYIIGLSEKVATFSVFTRAPPSGARTEPVWHRSSFGAATERSINFMQQVQPNVNMPHPTTFPHVAL